MSTELHEFPAEEVMAYLDGEVTSERALALADHLQQCAECASLADDFCALSQQLVAWKIEPSPLVESPANLGVEALTAEEAMGAFKFDRDFIAALPPAKESAPAVSRKSSLLSSFLDFIRRPRIQRPWVWAFASGCVVILIVSSLSLTMRRPGAVQSVAIGSYETKNQDDLARALRLSRALRDPKMRDELERVLQDPKARDELSRQLQGGQTTEKLTALDTSVHSELATKVSADDTAKIDNLPINGRNYIAFTKTDSQASRDIAPTIGAAPTSGLGNAGPMIEKTASLFLVVKEMDAARAALEAIEKRHHGYLAELNTEGQSEAERTLAASLRVPAGELDATLAELRKLGHIDQEKQGGEEVSQQHVDLEARLQNARNTEKRLTNLLIKRADKLRDVLDVERELASTREEIERMEAQLRNMENQVSYASIDLKLREEYKPALNLAPPATGTRMRNALVDGYHSAVESALGLVLFLFQEGPSILFWLLLLFFPARWTWRKLRALAAQKQSIAGAL